MDGQSEISLQQKWTATAILGLSVPLYAFLCWPAINDRGYPGISPIWGTTPYLWIVPIIVSKLFDGGTWRKPSLYIYTLVAAFFFSGTQYNFVPHHETVDAMLFKTGVWGPVNLLIAYAIEKTYSRWFKSLTFWNATPSGKWMTPSRFGIVAISIGILGLSISFPFARQSWLYSANKSQARTDAERDWNSGTAIHYVNYNEFMDFGESDGCYSVVTGLKAQIIIPGEPPAFYYEEYRSVISNKLAKFGPAGRVKDLCSKEEIQQWVKEGRFRRAETLPLKHGTSTISLSGYQTGRDHNAQFSRGEPSSFLYFSVIPEKKDLMVVITEDDIFVFAKSGELLQSVNFNDYQKMGINEGILKSSAISALDRSQ